MSNEEDCCDCEDPKKYEPKGIVAPLAPIGSCLDCGKMCNDSEEGHRD